MNNARLEEAEKLAKTLNVTCFEEFMELMELIRILKDELNESSEEDSTVLKNAFRLVFLQLALVLVTNCKFLERDNRDKIGGFKRSELLKHREDLVEKLYKNHCHLFASDLVSDLVSGTMLNAFFYDAYNLKLKEGWKEEDWQRALKQLFHEKFHEGEGVEKNDLDWETYGKKKFLECLSSLKNQSSVDKKRKFEKDDHEVESPSINYDFPHEVKKKAISPHNIIDLISTSPVSSATTVTVPLFKFSTGTVVGILPIQTASKTSDIFSAEKLNTTRPLSTEKPRTRQRASSLNGSLVSTYSKEDSRVYLVYPPELEAKDAVTIRYGDVTLLDPGAYFNDNLIDLMMKHLISGLPEEKRKKVHAFSGLFYAKLLEVGEPKKQHQLVHRWTKNVDLFSLDFILFPISLKNHWSLVVLARPQSWIQQRKAASIKIGKAKEEEEINVLDSIDEDKENGEKLLLKEENVGIFLHLDSLNIHPTKEIVEVLTNYLLIEKEAKENSAKNVAENNVRDSVPQEPKDATSTKSASKKIENIIELDSPVSNKEIEGPLVNTDEEKLPTEKEKDWVLCEVPTQKNGYDCGVFVIRFAKMIFDKWPTTTSTDLRENCRRQFLGEFYQSDIDKERQSIRRLLECLQGDWLLKNPEKVKE